MHAAGAAEADFAEAVDVVVCVSNPERSHFSQRALVLRGFADGN
jgi:hypothetical protein